MKNPCYLILIALLLCLSFNPSFASDNLEYPRVTTVDGNTLKIHHPVIDRWDHYQAVEGWIPVEVKLRGSDHLWVGSVRARASTTMDINKRLVSLSATLVLDVRFTGNDVPEKVVELAKNSVIGEPRTVLLDEVLSMLADDFKVPDQGGFQDQFSSRPPRIVMTETPMQLLLIDQQPVKAPISGTDLEFVVNTDWNLFYDKTSRSWYVLNQGAWQNNAMLATGGWNTVDDLPADFTSLSMGEDWSMVRDAMPATIPSQEPTPFMVSLEATELVFVDGSPRLGGIPGAGALQEVTNTESDLFKLNGKWYYLASGRWFTSRDFKDKWVVVESLPSEFGNIPGDHRRASVLASVPGTTQAQIAMMEATLPQQNEVLAKAILAQEVGYVGQPRFEPIPNTRVERAVNSPYAVIRHNNFYYLCYEAAWYFSRNPVGPWEVALAVPDEIYSIPPSDPLHYVTYVRPALDNQQGGEKARFTYNSGYDGLYSNGVTVVRGTGWNYSPWVGYPGGYPVYWGYPHTYGRHYRGARAYRHPFSYYGGYWPPQTITLNSGTRGVGGQAEVSEQDPRKARAGYDYSTLDQQREQALNAADDLYSDKDGQVYRRDDDGWSQHSGGEWNTMAALEQQYGVSSPQAQAPESGQRQAYKQDQDQAQRMEDYYQRRSKNYNIYSSVYVRR